MGKSGEFDFERILNKAVALGASYADVRYQYLDDELVTVENKELKTYSSRRLSGAGIRIVIAGAVGYASTSDLRENRLEKSLRNAIKAAKSIKGQKHLFAETKINKTKVKSTAKIDPCNVPPEDKVSIVLDANKNAWISNDVKNATTRLGLVKDFRQFTSSEGTHVEVETTLVGLSHASVAKVNGAMESVNDWGDSRCAGFEFIKCEDWNSFTAGVSKLAIEAAKSGTPLRAPTQLWLTRRFLGLYFTKRSGTRRKGISCPLAILYFVASSATNWRAT